MKRGCPPLEKKGYISRLTCNFIHIHCCFLTKSYMINVRLLPINSVSPHIFVLAFLSHHMNHLPEALLHYAWQSLRYRTTGLQTTDGQPISILQAGIHNTAQGPDFSRAIIRIGETTWHGDVEMHIRSEDWYRHGHDTDPFYNTVVLHVVATPGSRPIVRADGTLIPELVIGDRLDPDLPQRSAILLEAKGQLPCGYLSDKISAATHAAQLEHMGRTRMERKASLLYSRLEQLQGDWDQLVWEEVAARAAGMANGEFFRRLAQLVPLRWLRHIAHDRAQLAAVLMGATGLPLSGLDSQHWAFFQQKYGLQPLEVPLATGHIRAANAPEMRLRQLAGWVQAFPVPSQLLNADGFRLLLRTRLDAGQKAPKNQLGASQKAVIVINALIPLAYLYARVHGNNGLSKELINYLKELSPEQNKVTKLYTEAGWPLRNALHSQGMLELQQHLCKPRHCLRCMVGQAVMKL